jgi:hypothetical protein
MDLKRTRAVAREGSHFDADPIGRAADAIGKAISGAMNKSATD